MKKVAKILVSVAVLCVVVVAAVWFVREKSMPIKAEEVIANLEWGMSCQEAKLAMAREGYTKSEYHEVAQTSILEYQIRDYQGIEGANCELLLFFDEDKLSEGYYSFRTESAYFEEGENCYSSEEMVDKLQVMFAKRYESSYNDSISEEYHEDRLPEDPDYGRYFVGDKSLVFVIRRSSSRLDVLFQDLSSPEMKEYIEALKILDITDSSSSAGYYSEREE